MVFNLQGTLSTSVNLTRCPSISAMETYAGCSSLSRALAGFVGYLHYMMYPRKLLNSPQQLHITGTIGSKKGPWFSSRAHALHVEDSQSDPWHVQAELGRTTAWIYGEPLPNNAASSDNCELDSLMVWLCTRVGSVISQLSFRKVHPSLLIVIKETLMSFHRTQGSPEEILNYRHGLVSAEVLFQTFL